jgi:hypothetical protein
MDTVEDCLHVREERKAKRARRRLPRVGTISSPRPEHLEMPTLPRIGSQSVKCQIHCETCQL